MDKQKLGLGGAIGAGFLFGLGNPYAKLAALEINPIMISLAVTIVASAAFAALLLINKPQRKFNSKDAVNYLSLGILGYAIPSMLTMWAFTMTSAMNVLFLLRCEIFTATILGVAIFREKINSRQILGIAIGFLGVGIFATELNFSTVNFGDIVVIIASVFWASYGITSKRLEGKLEPLQISALRNWVGLPIIAIVALIAGSVQTIPETQYSNIGIFALSTYVFGVYAYNYGISRIGVWKTVVPAQLLTVVFGFVFTYIILGETLTAFKMAGGALIIFGLLLTMSDS